MASVLVEGVSIQFPLYHGNARSLKKTMLAAASNRMGENQQHRVVVEALRDVSFSLSRATGWRWWAGQRRGQDDAAALSGGGVRADRRGGSGAGRDGRGFWMPISA